jgi:hypothetical protein
MNMLDPLSAPNFEAIHGLLGYWSWHAAERFTEVATILRRWAA